MNEIVDRGKFVEFDTMCTPIFSDYDIDGILHFTRYFSFFESARFEFAQQIGLNEEQFSDLFFPVIEAKCDYKEPISLHDDFFVRTTVEIPMCAKIVFHHSILDSKIEKTYATACTIVAIVSKKKGLLLSLDIQIKNKIQEYIMRGE